MSASAYLSTTGACDGDVHRFGSPGEILSGAKQEGEGVKVPPRLDTGQLNGRVMYIDSCSLTRECIGELLKTHLKGFEVRSIPSWSKGEFDAIDRQPRAAIINSGSEPISSSAVAELINDITAHTPDTHIILLSNHDDFESISQAFALGVKGYIPTSLTSLVVVEVVRLVCLGGSFAPPSALLQRSHVQMVPPGCREPRDCGIDGSTVRFTQRQVEILNCLRCGLSNKLVAHELSMSLTRSRSTSGRS